ncbi:TetR/AcrR family transcriptional regulator [Streptomyces boetiae]|uniref:TetR/AcrR family transcriptional regulator n=1 Tax=Streptomyces boetiae TaxID=3075541 RepID=UPI00374E0593
MLSAARDVFGELGYGAPMEEVARRARVGVGTVYRRFPNKEALVRHIAEEETQRLTSRALEALEALAGAEEGPWPALAGFVERSAASGAGRLLPPELLDRSADGAGAGSEPRGSGRSERPGRASRAGCAGAERVPSQRCGSEGASGRGEPGVPAGREGAPGEEAGAGEAAQEEARGGTRELLSVVGELLERTRAAGELRADVTVADLMLVIATTPPRFEDPARQTAAEARLLKILLEGLRAKR